VATGILLMAVDVGGTRYAVFNWGQQSFGPRVPSEIMRLTTPPATLIVIGIQLVFGALLLGFIEMDGRCLPADVTTP
jgi:hypothetical protein